MKDGTGFEESPTVTDYSQLDEGLGLAIIGAVYFFSGKLVMTQQRQVS